MIGMGRVNDYKNILKNLPDWDGFLLRESGLPGPRANLELLQAVVELGSEQAFLRYLDLDSRNPMANTSEEFLAICGTAGLGRLVAEGKREFLNNLCRQASDQRWRIRESVAIALQLLGETDMDLLLSEMRIWAKGNLLERRAVVAALCELKLLRPQNTAHQVLELLDRITEDLLVIKDRKAEDFKVLRKALGYGWSVAVVAEPPQGKELLEKWFSSEDRDICWIMKENLRKERLNRMDKEWTLRWKEALGVKV